ncbi:MAG: DUF1501 domain-containing protein, partial [Planctomycetales bacterium]|nr:DUF1501 domain-containing protein [Planctomycetales bacterium]
MSALFPSRGDIALDGYRREQFLFDRRHLLRCGGLSCLGLNLGGLLRAQSTSQRSSIPTDARPGLRACIVVFYYGGPSHLDTFDPKPEAPSEVRGEFKPISTSVPGLQICEHMPQTAKVMHHVALVRSMHHTNRLHDSASIESLTGRQASQGDREEFAPVTQFYPCHGATLSYMRRYEPADVPHAALPWVFHNVVDVPCQGGGFLGPTFDPFRINGDATKVSYRAEMFDRPEALSLQRLAERRTLAEHLARDNSLDKFPATQDLKALYGRAIELMQSEAVARALRIDEEPLQIRERYGLYPGPVPEGVTDIQGRQLRGQNLLLARRLVEAGVPFVNVYDFRQQGQNWDSHANNFHEHKARLLPPADQAFAALVEDLESRGLLETTLVIAMGEFGRTPKINANAGRDHW